MRFLSTRGGAEAEDFEQALVAGLARDGGLFQPESYPTLQSAEISALAGAPYDQVALRLTSPFVGASVEPADLAAILSHSYARFTHPAAAPLVQIGTNLFVLELFHGPTLAFKDFAMQPLARLMNHVLQRRGERTTVVGATSGDTGAAAVEAFRDLSGVDLFILFPKGRVSEAQRRQMTCVEASNVHVVAVEGTFDDCQAIVKGLFDHLSFRDEQNLAGVNSINFARVMLQIVYYFVAAVALGGPWRKVSFAVPTGNFGDVLAGWMAKRMGLPVERLIIATNENDILARTLATGSYELRPVQATQSPSMDIQVSSNFERLLFEAYDRHASRVKSLMASLAQGGRFEIDPEPLANIRRDFEARRAGAAETRGEIARVYADAGYLLDPHTAVAIHAAREAQETRPDIPMIVLGTAHPAKFAEAVASAVGSAPEPPRRLADLMSHQERFAIMPNDQGAIERFIRARSSARAAS